MIRNFPPTNQPPSTPSTIVFAEPQFVVASEENNNNEQVTNTVTIKTSNNGLSLEEHKQRLIETGHSAALRPYYKNKPFQPRKYRKPNQPGCGIDHPLHPQYIKQTIHNAPSELYPKTTPEQEITDLQQQAQRYASDDPVARAQLAPKWNPDPSVPIPDNDLLNNFYDQLPQEQKRPLFASATPPSTPTTHTLISPEQVEARTIYSSVNPNPDQYDQYALRRAKHPLSHDPALFVWDAQRLEAAALLAGGARIGDVAKAINATQGAINAWLCFTPFRDRIAELANDIKETVLREGIAVKVNRIRSKNNRYEQMLQILRERAERLISQFPDAANVPGASTGLLVRKVKIIGSGLSAREIVEYELDTDVVDRLSALETEAAKELGQLTERQELTVIPKAYVGVNLDDV